MSPQVAEIDPPAALKNPVICSAERSPAPRVESVAMRFPRPLVSAFSRSNPPLQATASDISAAALQLARNNAKRHGVAVSLLQSDWFAHIRGQFEVIISNPPYVASDDPHLSALTTEPRQALVAGRDGLDAIRTIAMDAGNHLRSGGTLLLEHGDTQAEHVAALLRAAGWGDVRVIRDLAGLPRVSIAAR